MELPFYVSISKTLPNTRALIAARDIKEGEILEEAPVVILKKEHLPLLEDTIIANYYFDWEDDQGALCLGYGSIFNHSYTPNVFFDYKYDERILIFKAIRDIKEGEELYINYGQGCEDEEDPIGPRHLNFDREML